MSGVDRRDHERNDQVVVEVAGPGGKYSERGAQVIAEVFDRDVVLLLGSANVVEVAEVVE